MKLGYRILILFLIFCFNNTVRAQTNMPNKNFLLKGDLIGDSKVGFIYLISYNDDNIRQKDSCQIINGKFQFKGKVNCFSDKFYLKLDGEMRLNNDSVNSVNISLDNSIINIALAYNNFSKFKMSGCPSYDELTKYEKRKSMLQKKIDKVEAQIEENTANNEKKITEAILEAYRKKMIFMDISYCKANPNSNISPYLLYWLHNKIEEWQYEKYSMLYNKFSKKQQNSFYGKRIKQKIKENYSVIHHIGKKAPIFSGSDLNRKIIHLDSLYKHDYVLLDFWASWCIPCRAESKHLRNIYKEYHPKGLEIVSISEDKNISKWKEAISSDSIYNWRHILLDSTSIKKWEGISGTIDEYHIQFLPTKILIDKMGIIIGRYAASEGNKLDKKLNELF